RSIAPPRWFTKEEPTLPTDSAPRRPGHVMVTGAAGFIGSNLVRWLLKHWPETRVLSLDALCYAGNPANLAEFEGHSRHRFIHGSITDRDLVGRLLDEGVDAIISTAAQTHVDRSLMGADEFVSANIGGVQVQLD